MTTETGEIDPYAVAHISITYTYTAEGKPDIATKYDGDFHLLLAMLVQTQEIILRNELKGA